MNTLHTQFITDQDGKILSVILPIDEYRALLEELEELDDIRLYDEAKKIDEPLFSVKEAFEQIENARKKGQA